MQEAQFPVHAVLLRNDKRNTQSYVMNALATHCEIDHKEAQSLVDQIENEGETIVFRSMALEKVEEVVASLKAMKLSAFLLKGDSAK